MTNTYNLSAHLLCHDIRLSDNVFATVEAEKEPTEQEAAVLLRPAAQAVLRRSQAEDYPYELSGISVKQSS